jgi:heme-degrading monooxygenase HmoA
MPISIPQMPAEAYEQIIANVGQPLRESEGFISHAAEITPDGVTVTEVWETREQWQRWCNASVRPHGPADAPEPTVTELPARASLSRLTGPAQRGYEEAPAVRRLPSAARH